MLTCKRVMVQALWCMQIMVESLKVFKEYVEETEETLRPVITISASV